MKEKARQFAEKAHEGQVRKTRNIPYITHPIRVASRLEKAGASESLVCAAYLHDVVEDTPVSIEEIESNFGKRIRDLVEAHTEDKSKSWKERKAETINTLKHADAEIKQLIIADRLDNLLSLEMDLAEIGSDVWNVFNAGYESQKWYNEELVHYMYQGQPREDIPDFFYEFEQAVKRIFK